MNKMMLLCTLSVFIAGCSSTPQTVSAPAKTTAVAAAAPAETTTTVAAAKEKDNEMVCEMRKLVGSNVKKKVCATKARIAELQSDTQRVLSDWAVGNTQSIKDK